MRRMIHATTMAVLLAATALPAGAQAGPLGHGQAGAAPLAANDAYLAGAAGVGLGGLGALAAGLLARRHGGGFGLGLLEGLALFQAGFQRQGFLDVAITVATHYFFSPNTTVTIRSGCSTRCMARRTSSVVNASILAVQWSR